MFWNKKREPKYIVANCELNCLRERCPKWVVLYHNMTTEKGEKKNVQEGKCAIAWLPTLIIELTEAIRTKKC